MTPEAQEWFNAMRAYRRTFGEYPPAKWINQTAPTMVQEAKAMREAVASGVKIQEPG